MTNLHSGTVFLLFSGPLQMLLFREAIKRVKRPKLLHCNSHFKIAFVSPLQSLFVFVGNQKEVSVSICQLVWLGFCRFDLGELDLLFWTNSNKPNISPETVGLNPISDCRVDYDSVAAVGDSRKSSQELPPPRIPSASQNDHRTGFVEFELGENMRKGRNALDVVKDFALFL